MKCTPVKRGIVAALAVWGVLGGYSFITMRREAALCRAAGEWNVSAVSELLAQGTNPNAVASWESFEGGHHTITPLIAASLNEEPTKDKPITPRHWFSGSTPLDGGRIVTALIAAGADVNGTNPEGATPLSTADDPEIVNVLLRHGADPNFRPQPSVDTPLLSAISHGNLAKVKRLILAGANVNARNADGTLPLDRAQRYLTGFTPEETASAIVEALIKAGAKSTHTE